MIRALMDGFLDATVDVHSTYPIADLIARRPRTSQLLTDFSLTYIVKHGSDRCHCLVRMEAERVFVPSGGG